MIYSPMDGTRPRSRSLPLPAALLSIALAHVAVQSHVITAMLCPARDGARYVKYALRLEEEREPLAVLRSSDDHPGYPLLLHGAFRAAKTLGIESPANRIRVAQLVTSASGLLLAFASYFACRRLWGGLAAWVATFSLVTLARPAQTFADVLSDAPHALFWTVSLLCALRGLERGRARWFALAGLASTLAYWVRVDAVALGAAVLGACGLLVARRRMPVGLALRSLAAFGSVFAVGLAGFYLACHRLSTKPVALKILLGDAAQGVEWPFLAVSEPLALWRPLLAIGHYVNDLGQEVQFVHLATAGVSLLFWLRQKQWRGLGHGAIFAAILFGTYSALILAVNVRYGYLAGRYFLALVPLLAGFGAHGILRAFPRRSRSVALALVLASLAASAPSVLKRRIHEPMHGKLEAGRWLAERIQPGDTVFDRYFFPSYLAGIRGSATSSAAPPEGPAGHFLIVDQADLTRHPALERLLAEGKATRVVSFSRRPTGREGEVGVYKVAR